ncbi:hypothetical protein Tco_0961031 [Tanacetum coccineum]
MEECHKLLTDKVDDAILKYNVSKPLPLGGEPGHLTIQSDFFFNKDLEYLRYGRKIGRPALSISKMKAAFYPDVGLDLEQLGTGSETAERHKTHMRILSVIRIEVFSMYGYNYMKKIILSRADSQGICPSRKGISNICTLTQLNLTKPRWEATRFEFKHDFTVIDAPRAVTFRDKYGVQMIMRFNYKFSDGTLQQIDEALDYRVKEFQINRPNLGMNTRFWTKKYVDRSKEFLFAIQKRLKTRCIFRNLESFVGGRIREDDYRLL